MNSAALIIPRSENTRRRKDLFLCTQAVARGLSARDGRLYYPNSETERIMEELNKSAVGVNALHRRSSTKATPKPQQRASAEIPADSRGAAETQHARLNFFSSSRAPGLVWREIYFNK